jgi:hypothetical protein
MLPVRSGSVAQTPPAPKGRRLGEGKKMMTWRGGTHKLGRRIGKLLEQIVF